MSKRRSKKKKKKQPENSKLEDTARQVVDRLDRVRDWIDEVQHDAGPKSKAFYSHKLISDEQLLTLRDILGALPGVEQQIEPPAVPPSDDADWEDGPDE